MTHLAWFDQIPVSVAVYYVYVKGYRLLASLQVFVNFRITELKPGRPGFVRPVYLVGGLGQSIFHFTAF